MLANRKQNLLSGYSLGLCLGFFILGLLLFTSVLFSQDEIVYEDEGRHDPFMPLVTRDGRLLILEPTKAEEKIILGGIIYVEKGVSYAIINGEVVSVGDYILGHSVFSIEENKVILIKDNEPVEYILDLEKEGL